MKKIVNHLKENWIKYGFETFVIIVGILGAFTLNNWNEVRKEQLQELNYLTVTKTDLEVDLARIEGAIRRYQRKISRLYFLDSTFRLPRDFTPLKCSIDEISVSNMINRQSGFRLTMGSYKLLTSSATAGLIKNDLLLQMIQELYETKNLSLASIYADIKRREDFIGQKYAIERKYSSAEAFFVANPNKKEVFADFDFYYGQLRLYYGALKNMEDLMSKLIDDINTELYTRT